MTATIAGFVVAACIFAGAMFGLALRHWLPERHLSKESTDAVRLGTGVLSVLASLVLGLLIATAKSGYDATDHAVRAYAAELILMDKQLRDFGDQAASARALLRQYTATVLDDNWPKQGDRHAFIDDSAAGMMLEHVRDAVRALRPADADANWLREQALEASTSLMQQRWLLIEQSGPMIRPIILAILVSWVTLIFTSFGLSSPANATVGTALLVCSLGIGGSIFLILEMDRPFDGVLRISPRAMESALAHMQG